MIKKPRFFCEVHFVFKADDSYFSNKDIDTVGCNEFDVFFHIYI